MDSKSEEPKPVDKDTVPAPPRGLAMFMLVGPGLVWCGEYIGSGEVILSTRTGAVLGIMALWVPTLAVFAKLWIGLAGARYTVCTGEGMIDMMSRTPGPKNWVIWPVFIGQICMGAVATGALATIASKFAAYFIPIEPFLLGWIITFIVIGLVWGGKFDILKKAMSILVAIIIIGVFDVARVTWPGWGTIATALFGFQVPEVAEWARNQSQVPPTAWAEILPLLGWAAGGFASQVWYTYWVLGAGYGMTHGREYGQPLDEVQLRNVTVENAHRLKQWCRVVYLDASVACIIGITVTGAFMIAGAGILRPAQIAPDGPSVALELSRLFSGRWGTFGAHLFILSGLAAMVSTMLGQFAGWPRLLADCARLLIPSVSRFSWKAQFRFILLCYAASNMIIVYWLGHEPVLLAKVGAVLDGLLLTPLQAVAVGLTLYVVMPKFFAPEVQRILKPHPVFALGLALAFVVFTYFCVYRLPGVFGH